MSTHRALRPQVSGWGLCLVAAVSMTVVSESRAQQSFATGQNIAPAYEGWEKNADGSFDLMITDLDLPGAQPT